MNDPHSTDCQQGMHDPSYRADNLIKFFDNDRVNLYNRSKKITRTENLTDQAPAQGP